MTLFAVGGRRLNLYFSYRCISWSWYLYLPSKTGLYI